MGVAIIHDHFLYKGGAERVLFAMLEIYPTADVYLAFADKKCLEILKKKTKGKVFVSWFNNFPFSNACSSFYKLFVFFAYILLYLLFPANNITYFMPTAVVGYI